MLRLTTMVCLGVLMLAGCDDGSTTGPPTSRPVSRRADAPVPTHVAFRTLATLSPDRAAQLAPTADGAIYALHARSAGSGAIVERIDAKGETLTPESILRALNLADRGTGQIVAIAARDDGKLAFAFVGDVTGGNVAGRVAAIGTWEPATNVVVVTIDQADLARADAKFADDIAVSRPTLLVDADAAQLWRTTEAGGLRLLKIDELSTFRPTLETRSLDVGDAGNRVERRAWEWTHGDGGAVLLTDTASRWIRTLDVATGKASHVARFEEDAAGVSAIGPATLDAAGRVMTLAIDREGVARSLLVQDGTAFTAIDASRWQLDGATAAGSLRVDRLTPIPGSPGRYVAHDVASGQVFRVAVE